MSAGPLLVPMHVDAMVLNAAERLATPFRWFQADYGALRRFGTLGPGPFAGGDRQPAGGVHLHWTLPRQLRHGTHTPAEGSTSFRLAPNRWVVVRIQHSADAGAVKAWIVESDHTAPSSSSSAWPPASTFVDPAGLDGHGLPQPVTIGRSYELTPTVSALGTIDKPFLTAVGPGSAHFSIFAPSVQNVFALYDDVSAPGGAKPIDAAEFTYHVAGWYSDPAADPLATATWERCTDPALAGAFVDDELGLLAWLGNADPPSSMLVHGLAGGVAWKRGSEDPPPASYPVDTRSTVKVAFGNTALDALGAVVRLNDGSQAEADLLEAFGYGLLDRFDKAGSAVELDAEIREHWFGSTPSGITWTVVAPEAPGSTALPTEPPPPLTTAQADRLARLNAAQRELDRRRRVLESMRWRLYALWFKQRWIAANALLAPVPSDFAAWLQTQLANQIGLTAPTPDPGGWYIDEVRTFKHDVDEQAGEVREAVRSLDALLDPAALVRKHVPLPPYRAPNDPVLLATALGRSTNLDPVGDQTCRIEAQTVASVTVTGHAYTAVPPPLPDPNGLLPAAVQALHAEAVCLSPSLFAADALRDATRADDVRDALRKLPAPGVGVSFAPAAGSHDEWTQPWVPLLLDWEVIALGQPAYLPPRAGAPVDALVREHWEFNGTDYRWTGPTATTKTDFSETASASMTLSGRTFITPQLSFTIAGRLDDWVRTHSERSPKISDLVVQLKDAVDALAAQDMLSQRLSGLRSLLVQRDETPTVPPSGAILDALGARSGRLSEQLRGSPAPYPDEVAPPVWDFAPMSGTFVVVTRLSVIDFMGRTVNLILTNGSQAPATARTAQHNWFYPILAPGLRSPTTKDPTAHSPESVDPTPRMLMLPPRFAQDAQLWLALSTNDGSDAEVDLVAGGDAVCGWLVPNHLDRSVVAYAPDGTPWGELFLAAGPGDAAVIRWEPDPTNPGAPASVGKIPNVFVRGMLTQISNRADNGAGFADLLTTIDTTLGNVDIGGKAFDEDLAVLVGRPLAVVRAQVSLRLRGLARLSQDWWNTFDVNPDRPPDPDKPAPLGAVDGGVRDHTWSVRLGDAAMRGDGLVGYFQDDPDDPTAAWKTLNAVQRPADAGSDYLRQIGEDGNYVQLRPIDDTVRSPDPKRDEVARLTLLLDPRGTVHAFTGVLPVTELALPPSAAAKALATVAYLFRAGPLLSSASAIRIPRPAENNGSWEWFDHVTGSPVPVAPADARVQIGTLPASAREGWLRFTPAPPKGR